MKKPIVTIYDDETMLFNDKKKCTEKEQKKFCFMANICSEIYARDVIECKTEIECIQEGDPKRIMGRELRRVTTIITEENPSII